MANLIRLISISELLETNFFIPSYQRGYRWTSSQVEELLNDVYTFAVKEKERKEFYCLQPVVVKRHSWEEQGVAFKGWELVDGQQRLTTIYILLRYLERAHLRGSTLLEEFDKGLFTLTYETRPCSAAFLENIGSIEETLNIDYYHMAAAYDTISKWFAAKPKKIDARTAILSTLTHDRTDQKKDGIVQVIWYEIEAGQNPIDTFIRINLGKIPLTSAELIKALFLQERNFGAQQELGDLRQPEIAREWDQIENSLQNEEFWWFLNKEKNTIPSRIGLIFNLMCAVACARDVPLAKRVGSDKFATFRFFSIKFEEVTSFAKMQAIWQEVKDHFMSFEEWFNNPAWYHYIGFLICCDESVTDLYQLTRKQSTKEKITGVLRDRIRCHLKGIDWEDDPGGAYLKLFHPKHNEMIKRVLLLFNLVPVIRQNEQRKLIYKFPFQAFKEGHWDIEHIDAYTSRDMKKRRDQLEWLEFAMDDLREIITDEELLGQISEFMNNTNSPYNFDYLLERITAETGEAVAGEEDVTIKNNIGNLTLLNSSVNRAYGNALFPTKRRKIIEYDAEGDFMPMNTKNVFLKYYDLKGKSRASWSQDDMKKYRAVIAETLNEFLPPQKFNGVSYE